MSSNRINVNLAFSAETGKAKQQIQELQTLLSKIAYQGATISSTDKLSIDLHQASEAAKELQFHLNNAFNATTGNFDLSLLDKSLKTSNSNITDLSTKLLSAGQTGQQAFLKLAQSISMADQPMFKINSKLKELVVSIKNAARWQISSNIIHGLQGGIQSAYNYAQDLNKSLNNIRIVTGYNTDKMAEFAEQANKAAKALSTTTTDYTDASLIYFQQGLSDAEVQGRTDTTIKLANVTGQSVEETANQMTAIWNNFDDGSKSLDYYADVITALGAATASSSKEISEGLNKFSAVAESVGLSYEYASAALATVTATTRQSADIVGNAFKTLFARIQGLNLGETLDDGTTLNKYSEALFKVGINIKDQSGQLKDMNTILDEMGNKWSTLDKDQQNALAQTVGGVRQYTQLIALMDNWDYFQQNLGVATGSEGTLQKQADIYAESWEAAEKKVKAAAESIYQSLIDDKFFISINNGFANLLTGIGSFVKEMGGAKSLLLGFSSILISNFANKIPEAIQTAKYNLQLLTPKGTYNAYQDIHNQMIQATGQAFTKYGVKEDSSTGYAIKQANELTVAKTKLALVNDKLSASERQSVNTSLAIIQAQQNEVIALKQKNEELQKSIDLRLQSMQSGIESEDAYDIGYNRGAKVAKDVDLNRLGVDRFTDFEAMGAELAQNLNTKLATALQNARDNMKSFAEATTGDFNLIEVGGDKFKTALDEISSRLNQLKNQKNMKPIQDDLLSFIQILPDGVRQLDNVKKAIDGIKNAKGPKELKTSFNELYSSLEHVNVNGVNIKKWLEQLQGKKLDSLYTNMNNFKNGTDEASKKVATLQKMLNEFSPQHVVKTTEAFGALAGFMGNVVTIGNSLKSIFTSLDNPDLNGWERFSSVLMGISMIIPAVISSFRAVGTVTAWVNTNLVTSLALKTGLATTTMVQAASEKILTRAQQSGLKSLTAKNLAEWTEIITKETGIEKDKVAIALEELLGNSKYRNIKSIRAKIGAMLTENTIEAAGNTQRGIHIVLQKIINALTGKFGALWIAIAGIGIVAIITTIVVGLDALIVTQKEANKAIDEANEKYEEEKNKLSELEDKLASIKNKIDELQSKGPLSLTEESELRKLKQQEASLERQITLQKKLKETSQKEQMKQIEQNFEKSSGLTFESQITKNMGLKTYNPENGEYDISTLETLDQYKTRMEGLMGTGEYAEYSSFDDYLANNLELYQKIKDWEEEIQDNHNEQINKNSEQIQKNEENYLNYISDMQELKIDRNTKKDEIADMQKRLKQGRQILYGNEYESNILAPIISQSLNDLSGIDFTQANINWTDIIGLDNLDLAGVASEEMESYMDSAMDKINTKFKDLGLDVNDSLSKLDVESFETLIKNIDALENWDPNEISFTDFINGLDKSTTAMEKYINLFYELKENLFEIIKISNDLEIGDILSEEDYQLLLKYNEELEKYFMLTTEGYQYLGGASNEDFSGNIEAQLAKMQDYNSLYEYFSTQWMYNDGEKKGQQYDWTTETSSTIGSNTLRNLANSERGQQYLSLIGNGYDSETLLQWADKLDDQQTLSEDEINAVKAEIQNFLDELTQAINFGENSGEKAQNELIYSTAKSSNQLAEIHNKYGDTDAYDKALQKLSSQYDTCTNELEEYQEAIKKYKKNSDEVKTATQNLTKALKKAEWDKFTDEALDAAKALKTVTNLKDEEKNLVTIQKAFKNAFNMDVPIKTLEKYKDKIIEWGESGEEASDDIATQLYSLINAENEAIKGTESDYQSLMDYILNNNIDVGANTDDALSSFSKLEDFYSSVKSIVEANPPIVDAYGNADFSNMIAAMLEAGYTAADVAAALQSIGQTEVDFSAWGTGLPNVNFNDINSIIAFINALNSWKGDIAGSTNAPITSEQLKTAFPGGKVPSTLGSGGGRKPSSPSGGGGGGGSAPKHAEKKDDSDKERYHTLQNQLEDLSAEYEELSIIKDMAFGKEKLKAIDNEINKTDELINKQKEYLNAIKENLPIDKSVMEAYYMDVIGNTPIEFDERGNISNYDAVQDAMFAKYNQMTDIYDEDSEEWQVFEKKYEQLEKYIEQYEETYDLLRDEEAEYQDLLRQRIDLQLEKVQYSIEIQLEIPENEIAVIEYQLGKIEDDAFKSAEAIGLLTKKAENIYDQIQINKQGLNDLLELSLSTQEIIQLMNGDMSVLEGKTFTEDQIDAIKDYRDNLLDLNEEFDDIRENIEEQVMEVFDAWNEKLGQGIDKLDHYGNVLESYKNIIDIVGKDTLGLSDTFMATLNQSSIDNAINKVTATKKSYEAMIDAQSQAEQALEEAKARNDEASIKMWEENLQSITEEAQSAREEMLSAWEDALDGIAEQFEATVERVVDIFNKEIYTLGGLEGLSEDFNRQQENADIMLDDYQKIYELSKLSRDINKSIDDTDSISGKQKLKKLLEQINKLQEDGVEMSQYDLEYMQKTYDLRLAEIELEEAQKAKNTVRLRKDNEGNWSYVYTQNMDAVDTAQQKYEDALYAMQDVSSNYIDEMSEKLISTSQEMEEALAAIRIQDYANIDDYYAEVQRVQKQYEDELAIQQKELQKAIDNNKILYDEDWTNYHNATGYKISDTENFATTFRDTLLGSLMGSEEDTANFTDIISSAVNTLTQGLMQGAEVYYANLQDAMNAAGTSTEDFAKDFEEKIKEIEDKSEESTNKIKDLAKDMSSSLKDITDSVTTWQETYGEVMQQIINSNLDVINSFNDMLEALSIDKNSITVKYDILSDDTKKPEQYASGGYTGKWGNYGKLAILDEKELILNKDDTVNFLDALGIAKQIIDTIDLNALQASYGFGNLVPATINENNSQTIEQDVHITAEFPNATDHNEIEQAFETLINKASQYANRK